MEYIIEDTKTDSGTRLVPMTDDVKACFRKIIQNRKMLKSEPVTDGKSGFLYLDKNDMSMVALHREKYLQHICEKYKKYINRNYLKLHLMFADIPFVLIWQSRE